MARPARRRQDKLKRFRDWINLGRDTLKLGFQFLRLVTAIIALWYLPPVAEKSADLLLKVL
jgi:hypothetical protein